MCADFHRLQTARHELRRKAYCLQTCPDTDVPDVYHALLRKVEQLFGTEQLLMEEYGFPVRRSHLEQHARVLRGLHCVHAAVLQGATEQGRQVGSRLLMDWLRLHQDTIDAAFSVWTEYCDSGLIDPHDPCWQMSLTER